MHSQGRVFACRPGEQTLAAPTASIRCRGQPAFGLLGKIEGDLGG